MTRRVILTIMQIALLAAWAMFPRAVVLASDAVEEGRESLNDSVTYPWYDAENDDLRRVDLPEEKEPDEKDQSGPDLRTDTSGFGQVMGTIVQVLFWIFVVLVFAALVGVLIWAFTRGEAKESQTEGTDVVESSDEVDRMENLPFQVKRPQSDLLAEARRHYEQGNYREAIIYLFSYQLIQLDKFHFIRLTKGKTNRQYLSEVRPRPPISRLLERTMMAFEDVFFGDHDLERQQFEGCWNSLDEFHNHVSQGAIG